MTERTLRGTTDEIEERTSEQAAQRLQQIGREILGICRDELYFSMRFLDVALSSFCLYDGCGGKSFRDRRVSYVFSSPGAGRTVPGEQDPCKQRLPSYGPALHLPAYLEDGREQRLCRRRAGGWQEALESGL